MLKTAQLARSKNVEEVPAPSCICGIATIGKSVTKEGPHFGRPYYSCAKGNKENGGCCYFKWLQLVKAEADTANVDPRVSASAMWCIFQDLDPEPCVWHQRLRQEGLRQGGLQNLEAFKALLQTPTIDDHGRKRKRAASEQPQTSHWRTGTIRGIQRTVMSNGQSVYKFHMTWRGLTSD